MKRLFFSCLCAVCCWACSESEDVFYSTTYPVTEVKVTVTLNDAVASDLTTEQITEEALVLIPVVAGGSYRLDYSRFDGGELYVTPSEGAETLVGTFDKVPAASQMTFHYGDWSYSVRTGSYTSTDGWLCVSLNSDLTAYFQEKYGEAAPKQVIRHEYTTHLFD